LLLAAAVAGEPKAGFAVAWSHETVDRFDDYGFWLSSIPESAHARNTIDILLSTVTAFIGAFPLP